MTRATVTVTALSLLNFAFGFIAQLAVAGRFGASQESDVYFVAISVPLLAASMAAAVASTVLIPSFVRAQVRDGEAAAWRLASALATLLLAVLLAFSAVCLAAAGPLLALVAPGLPPGQSALAVELLRESIPMIVLLGLSSLAIGIQNARGSFAVPAASAAMPAAGLFVGAAVLEPYFGVRGLVVGQTAGAAAQFGLLSFGLFGGGKLALPSFSDGPALRDALKMTLSLFFGGMAYQFLPLIERNFASRLSEGSITHLALSARVSSLIGHVLAAGLAASMFPRLAKEAAAEDPAVSRRTLARSLRFFLVAAIPVVALSPLYSQPLIELLFERGRFGPGDTASVATILPLYIVAMVSAAAGTLIARGFYGLLQDTFTPSASGTLLVAVYLVACSLLTPSLGSAGLALSVAIYWFSAAVSAACLLRYRLGPAGDRGVLRSVSQSLLASALTYVALSFVLAYTPGLPLKVAAVATAFCLYAAATFLLGMEESVFLSERLKVYLRPAQAEPRSAESL